jgi:hypothetical protein
MLRFVMKTVFKKQSASSSMIIVRRYQADDDEVLSEMLKAVFRPWLISNYNIQREEVGNEESGRDYTSVNGSPTGRNQSGQAD